MKGDDYSYHNIKFALLKNSNLLPDPGMEKSHSTTFDNQWIELDSVDSTNNYAMARIHEGLATDGLVCITRHQWAGRGQRGKTWLDEPGQNLMMSLVLRPGSMNLSSLFLFSASVTLGIIDHARAQLNDHWFIKWPNDIYWNDRKAAGILIETVVQGENWLFAVAGVGMNLNQEKFPSEIAHAISLKQITTLEYDPLQFARELVPSIQKRVEQLKQDPGKILRDYNQSLYKRNQAIALKKGKERIIVTLQAVDKNGLLITSQGAFGWAEVEWIVNR